MDKINKNLRKLNVKERTLVEKILVQLKKQDFKSLNMVQLKGYSNIFRVRKSNIRIIFQHGKKDTDINILSIERRSEKTYRDF